MYEDIGYTLFLYSMAVTALAVLFIAAGWRKRRHLRAMGTRLFVLFGIFAATSAYVWLHAGPEADYRLYLQNNPSISFKSKTFADI